MELLLVVTIASVCMYGIGKTAWTAAKFGKRAVIGVVHGVSHVRNAVSTKGAVGAASEVNIKASEAVAKIEDRVQQQRYKGAAFVEEMQEFNARLNQRAGVLRRQADMKVIEEDPNSVKEGV